MAPTRKSKAIAPDAHSLGYLIRRLCGIHDVAPSVLAEYIGTRRAHVSNVMNGRQGFERDNIQRVARAFALPVDLLAGGNIRLCMNAAYLMMDAAPLPDFPPTGVTDADYLNKRKQESLGAVGETDQPAYFKLLQAAMDLDSLRATLT